MNTHRFSCRNSFTVLIAVAVMGLLFSGCPSIINNILQGGPASLANGLVIEVISVSIPEDLRPVVIFTIKDSKNKDVALSELTDARFILGYLDEPETGSTARYISYITRIENPDGQPNTGDEAVQSNYDSARLGGVTDNGDGTYTYKFAAAVPANYDAGATHQIAGQFTRLYPVDGQVYPYNMAETFLPDGGDVTATREIVSTETCNTCHTRLEFHGGNRREVQLCIMCHSTQSSDGQSGNSVDFAEMIHKIHMGEELPSVQDGTPYQIIGFGNSVNDYSTVVFSQDIRNCEVCHTNAPQADVFLTNPTKAGCASCHDRTWFGNPDLAPEGWEVHVAGEQVNDSLCSQCHKPTGPAPSPILEAHRLVSELPENPGLALNVLEVVTTPPTPEKQAEGTQITITFAALYGDGSPVLALNALNSITARIGYPAAEYETTFGESLLTPAGTLVNNNDGTYVYTFAGTVPSDSTDTFAVGMEGRIAFTHDETTFRQGTSTNGLMYFTLNEEEPEPRREVVSDAKCNVCHNDLHLHGANRVGVQYCVVCHNPSMTDVSRRPGDQLPPETVNFKDMIHRIHSGAELENGYLVYGFGNTLHDYSNVGFPGKRESCAVCHEEGTYELPVTEDALSTFVVNGEEVVRDVLPERAACTTCHDSLLANVHAIVMSDIGGGVETCAVCHGPGKDFDVEKVHALAP
ncbi:MAG: OmcA/MtrC family decaheme c-type cytochrome [Candidatus Hydrogenedentes bacterium]|nr:OmcA/MtrC family decaheme c-type cytochrome [Candidatus Hydrogenedentota bacterium]